MVEFGITYFISTLLSCWLLSQKLSDIATCMDVFALLDRLIQHFASSSATGNIIKPRERFWDGDGSVNFPVVVRSRFSSVHWDNVPISENWPHFSFSLDFTSNGFMKGKANPFQVKEISVAIPINLKVQPLLMYGQELSLLNSLIDDRCSVLWKRGQRRRKNMWQQMETGDMRGYSWPTR